MADPSEIVQIAEPAGNVATFEWRDLRFEVVTHEPLTSDQIRLIGRMAAKASSVGRFADVLGTILGRRVRIRTMRPSRNVRFEVGW